MKIDSNINNQNLVPENFDQAPVDSSNAAPPPAQTDSIDGPTGQVQQGLHSENADGTSKDAWSDYQVGTGVILGTAAATGGIGWGLAALFDYDLPGAVGNFVDSAFDAVGGVFDSLGQGIGGAPGDAISWFGNAIADTPEAVGDAITWTEGAIGDAGEWTGNAIADGAGAVADGTVDVINDAADAVSDAGGAVSDAVSDVCDW